MPQITTQSRADLNQNEFIVSPVVESNIHHEYREASAFGKMSKTVKERVVKTAQGDTTMDVAQSAAVWHKDIPTGDEARFTLVNNIDGVPTYGDSPVETGERLNYMNANCYLNGVDTPAIPIMEDMATHRVKDILSEQVQKGEVRQQVTLFFSEEDTLEGYRGFLTGASQNLKADFSKGGIALDLGRGDGLQASPENVLMPGYGSLPALSTYTSTALDIHEQNILDMLSAANADIATNGGTDPEAYGRANYGPRRGFTQDLREHVSSVLKIPPTIEGGKSKWYVLCDPDLYRRMAKEDSDLWDIWKETGPRSLENPVFAGYDSIELDGFVFIRDPWLRKFRPTLSATEVQWGPGSVAQLGIRKYNAPSSPWGVMCVLGNRAMLSATNGAVAFTDKVGDHGKGFELAANTKMGYQRLRWRSRDGKTDLLQQNSALVVAYVGTEMFDQVETLVTGPNAFVPADPNA